MGPKREHIWWIKKPFPKDMEEILMTNTTRMKLTMKRMRVMRATHSKFRRTEAELTQKNICKTLKNTYLHTQNLSFAYLLLINNLPTQNKC